MMDNNLVDHKDGIRLLLETMEGKGDRIACNVLPMFKEIMGRIDDLEERLQMLEAMLDV